MDLREHEKQRKRLGMKGMLFLDPKRRGSFEWQRRGRSKLP
jgi:hypothetical protein